MKIEDKVLNKIKNLSPGSKKLILKIIDKLELLLDAASDIEAVFFNTNPWTDPLADEYKSFLYKFENWGFIEFLDDKFKFNDLEVTYFIPPIVTDKDRLSLLKSLIGNDTEEKSESPTTRASGDINSEGRQLYWPDNFRWSDDKKRYIVDTNKALVFKKNKSTRKDVFDRLVSKKGGLMYVEVTASSLGISKANLEVVLCQIRDMITDQGLENHLSIESSKITGQSIAYKAVPNPKSKP